MRRFVRPCVVALSIFLFDPMSMAQVPAPIGFPVGISAQIATDSTFIGKFKRNNDIRFFYGSQSIGLAYGSRRESTPTLAAIFSNVNDFAGIGFTYKFIDVVLSFALPKTRVLNQDLQNLSQFKFALSYTGRKWVVRGYVSDIKGLIAADPNERFESKPDVHEFRVAVQTTYIVNHRRYSYRAAIFQNEFQRKTAGSFLLRIEPFYRSLGVGSQIVPASLDVPQVYGDQAGLQYLKAPGLLVMPGYGMTFKSYDGNFYVSPLIFAGPGIAFNFYKGNLGEFAYTNWEFGGSAALNIGYNHARAYVNLAAIDDVNYIPLNPSYFMSTNLRISLTVGYRFFNLEKFIPSGFP